MAGFQPGRHVALLRAQAARGGDGEEVTATADRRGDRLAPAQRTEEGVEDIATQLLVRSARNDVASLNPFPKRTPLLPTRCSSVHGEASVATPEVDVVIEIPRGSFLKRGSTGHIDFVSPLPCPFNYGSVPQFVGLDGDLLDAVVLGPRLTVGTRLKVRSWGAVTLIDRGMADDKLICSHRPLSMVDQQR